MAQQRYGPWVNFDDKGVLFFRIEETLCWEVCKSMWVVRAFFCFHGLERMTIVFETMTVGRERSRARGSRVFL